MKYRLGKGYTKCDRQDLMTKIDDFRPLSIKMFVTCIGFADMLGSVFHKFIQKILEKFDIPQVFHDLIEDLHKYSCFQGILSTRLSGVFYIICGTNTGDPLNAEPTLICYTTRLKMFKMKRN